MVVFSVPEDASYNGRVIYMFADRLAKGYIGKSVAFKRRVNKHKTDAHAKKDGEWKSKSIWNEAIRRIGWDNLTVMILEFVPEEVSLDERERFWIAKLKTKHPNGYNSNKGGGGPSKHTEEAKAKISAIQMNRGGKPVTSCLIKEEYADGTQLVEFVSYPSANEAERQTRVSHSNIIQCCLKNKISAGGRYWVFTKVNHPPQIIKVGEHIVPRIGDKLLPFRRKVFSESATGEKQLHEGIHAAKRTLSETTRKKFHISNICKCCSSKYKQTHHIGYKFYYATPEMIAEFKQNAKKRKRK